jgi:hypothetical protein
MPALMAGGHGARVRRQMPKAQNREEWMPAKLVKLQCRVKEGDDDHIYVDYGQYDESSDRPNHSHWRTIVSKDELRDMLNRMERHLEDPQDWIIFDEVRQNTALVELTEIMRESRLEDENKQQGEESWQALRKKQNEEKRLRLEEEIEVHARDYLAEIRRLSAERRLRREQERKQELELYRDWQD